MSPTLPFPDGERVLNVALRPEDGTTLDQCGLSLAILESMIVLGCPNDSEVVRSGGSVVVFEQNRNGEFVQTARLFPDDSGEFDFFGFGVATDGDTIVVGAFGTTILSFGEGSAYVFERNSRGRFVQTQQLMNSDLSNGDQFGRSVAVLGSTIVVGASFGDGDVIDGGAVYIFERDSRGEFQEVALLQASDATPRMNFGTTISMQEGRFVVGAFSAITDDVTTGAAYVFDFDETTETWGEVARLVPEGAAEEDQFATIVALDGDLIAVAAPGDDDAGPDFGAVFLFEEERNGRFAERQKITTTDSCSANCFGSGGLALAGNTLVVGSIDLIASDGNDNGVTFVFESNGSAFEEIVRLTTAEGGLSGLALGISDGVLAVGSPSGEIQGLAFVVETEGIAECQQQVTGFTSGALDSASVEEALFGVVDLDKFANDEVNIVAQLETCGQPIGLVRVEVMDVMSAVDRRAPFDLFGEPAKLPSGRQQLRAALCEDASCDVTTGALDVEIFVDSGCTPTITEIVAYDAFTDMPFAIVEEGAEICIPTSGDMNFEAVASCVDAIDFRLEGEDMVDTRSEQQAPYFLYGDDNGDVRRQYDSGPFPAGDFKIEASFTPQVSTPNNSGISLEVSFTLIDCPMDEEMDEEATP